MADVATAWMIFPSCAYHLSASLTAVEAAMAVIHQDGSRIWNLQLRRECRQPFSQSAARKRISATARPFRSRETQ